MGMIEHRLVQTQTQRLMLTQRMQQAIQILQYSGMELDQYVQQELEDNPVLEQIKEDPVPDAPEDRAKDDSEPFDDVSFDLDDYADQWNDITKEGRDLSYNPRIGERLAYLGGEMQIDSRPGKGTSVHLRIDRREA